VRLNDVIYVNGLYVAVGAAIRYNIPWFGSEPLVFTSPDAETWTKQWLSPLFHRAEFQRVAYGNGIIVAVGDTYNVYSVDGSRWNLLDNESAFLSLAFGDGFFVAVGPFGNIISSKDGISWKWYNTGRIDFLTDVAYGNNTFVAVSGGGRIYQSDPILALDLSKGLAAQLSLRGPVGRSCLIESADALFGTNRWSAIATVSLTNNPTIWVDSDSAAKPQRFYRAVLKP
jgi:hypothetical protein